MCFGFHLVKNEVWVYAYLFLLEYMLSTLLGFLPLMNGSFFLVCLCSPRFGIAHALCLGLAPWLAAEIPILVDSGMIKHKDDAASSAES